MTTTTDDDDERVEREIISKLFFASDVRYLRSDPDVPAPARLRAGGTVGRDLTPAEERVLRAVLRLPPLPHLETAR